MTKVALMAAVWAISAEVAGAQGTITAFAGAGFVDNIPAAEARLSVPQGLALDANGNAYFGDGYRIRRVDRTSGIISTVAGTGSAQPSTDGAATGVSVSASQLVFDASGNLLFLEGGCLRKLDARATTVSTLAGTQPCLGTFGPIGSPAGLAVDSSGNVYISDQHGMEIRKISPAGIISTVVGGPASSTLQFPAGLAIDKAGNLYVADSGHDRVVKIDAKTGALTTVAGNGSAASSGDGKSALQAGLADPTMLAFDSQGNLYIADGARVREVRATDGTIQTVAGNGQPGYSGDGGAATQAGIGPPTALAIDAGGNLWISDTANQRIRMVSAATGRITTVAGIASNGDGGPSAGALLRFPFGLAVSASGDVFATSQVIGAGVIRRVDHATGLISTFAGGGASLNDGVQATAAHIQPTHLAVDAAGNVVFSDQNRVRRVDAGTGLVTTLAGTGTPGYSGDGGQATAAQLNQPGGIAFDSQENLLIADSGNSRVRRVDSSGVITTIAGNGQNVYAGAGGPAAQASIGTPVDVATGSNGNLYIASTNLHLVLQVDTNGILTAAAGTGGPGYTGDGGAAGAASLGQPDAVAIDSNGNLFIADGTCSCVRRVAAGSAIIQTVAGGGSGLTGSSGLATAASLGSIGSIAIASGSLYVPDLGSGLVWSVAPPVPPDLPVAPGAFSVVNAASYQATFASPGEIVSLLGNYLGPATPVPLEVGGDGRVTNNLGGVQVYFNDIPAPLLYLSAGQINAVTPYAIAPGQPVTVRVQTAAGTSTLPNLSTAAATPAIFSGAVVNPDGTLNSRSNPAPRGATLVLYGTGMGQLNPAGVDGSVIQGPDLPSTVQQFQALIYPGTQAIASQQMTAGLAYLGPAPGYISGLMQVNVALPASVPGGASLFML
ncbi:MAG TPA: hypothetical protein VJ732_12290, partial [Bryobacteraceae bacterium]|nr:hypothetical protein [Bryobacteraceae bacterium]